MNYCQISVCNSFLVDFFVTLQILPCHLCLKAICERLGELKPVLFEVISAAQRPDLMEDFPANFVANLAANFSHQTQKQFYLHPIRKELYGAIKMQGTKPYYP